MEKYHCEGGYLGAITVTSDGVETIFSEGSSEDIAHDKAAAWALAFEEFNTARKANADAIASLAVENFHEVTHKTCFSQNL